MNTLKALLILFLFILSTPSMGQTEFTKGWLLNVKLTNGAISNFKRTPPDMYVGGLALNPQITVAPGLLRVGINAGAIYADKKISGLLGPMAAINIKTIGTKNMGSLANMHLIAEANWGTDKQQMVGGGIGFEIFQLAHLGITAQRDYKQNNWWIQSFIAIKINRTKQKEDEFSR